MGWNYIHKQKNTEKLGSSTLNIYNRTGSLHYDGFKNEEMEPLKIKFFLCSRNFYLISKGC